MATPDLGDYDNEVHHVNHIYELLHVGPELVAHSADYDTSHLNAPDIIAVYREHMECEHMILDCQQQNKSRRLLISTMSQ